MRRFGSTLLLLLTGAVLASCHHGSSESPPPPAPQSYSATVTAIGLARTADGQPLPVGGLPADGATITVR